MKETRTKLTIAFPCRHILIVKVLQVFKANYIDKMISVSLIKWIMDTFPFYESGILRVSDVAREIKERQLKPEKILHAKKDNLV